MSEENISTILERLSNQQGEDSEIEVKECSDDLSKDVWETVSAFANTGNGSIILGVSEKDGFRPVPNFSINRIRDQFLAGMGDGGSRGYLTNPPHYSISREEADGKPVLLIAVDELDASNKPCYITARGVQGGSYKRIDNADVPLSANEIYSLQNAVVASDSDRQPVVGSTEADLDESVCAQVFAKAQQTMPRALKDAKTNEVKLQRLNFVDKNGNATKAGLLSAGKYPQQFFPKLHVDVAVHAGKEKSLPGQPRFADRTLCEGTVGEMIGSAVSAVAKNLKREYTIDGISMVDELEIPQTVLREAIANALIHREYDARFDGESVAVDVFDDRVEIVNPGGLWGGKSRENLADGRSCCRNATLMKLTSIVPLPSGAGTPAEGNGTGIPLIINECAAKGLREPVFCPAIDHFKVILFRPQKNGRMEKRANTMKQGKKDERLVAALLEEYGCLSVRELSEKSGLTVNQVRSRINSLIGQGDVVATAPVTSKNRKYKLAD